MTYHIRVRPTALVLRDESVLLVEYVDENGLHYNLPGGGAEPGESIVEGALRELREETTLEAQVGPVAFVYEYALINRLEITYRVSIRYISCSNVIRLKGPFRSFRLHQIRIKPM